MMWMQNHWEKMRPLTETNWHRKCAKLNGPIAKACVDIGIDDDSNSSDSSSSDENDNWSWSEQKK